MPIGYAHKKTPEILAAEQREIDAQIKRIVARWIEDIDLNGDDLQREYKSKLARLALVELTRLGLYPRRRTTIKDLRHATAPGEFGGAYGRVNFKKWRERR